MAGPVGERERRARRPSSLLNRTPVRLTIALGFLYVFLVGVKALESGISAFGADFVDRVFAAVANPVAGLAAGVLATVLVQSSSVTTSTIVGLVGAGVLPVESAVPMVMGANIGTTVTNTLASLGHVRQGAYFERALAAATMHDFFNILAVVVLLPLQIWFGVISDIATWLASWIGGILPEGSSGESPVKDAIRAPVAQVEDWITALGWEGVAGWVILVLGIGLIFLSLWQITRQMKAVMSGPMESAINAVLSKGAGVTAMVVGLVLTVAVQSSSITTSILVPLVAAGILSLDNAFPVTLGANLGTTVTALLASVAADAPEALVIALSHVVFNVIGILIFYPWAPLRRLPIAMARVTAVAAVRRKALMAAYVVGLFVFVPLGLLFTT